MSDLSMYLRLCVAVLYIKYHCVSDSVCQCCASFVTVFQAVCGSTVIHISLCFRPCVIVL